MLESRDTAKNMDQARAVRSILRNQRHRHSQLCQSLTAQGQESRGGIQLTADRLGNSQAGPHTLGTPVKVLQGNCLFQVLAQKQGQIVL